MTLFGEFGYGQNSIASIPGGKKEHLLPILSLSALYALTAIKHDEIKFRQNLQKVFAGGHFLTHQIVQQTDRCFTQLGPILDRINN